MYWGDWLRKTRMLSPAAKGAWADFLATTWFMSPRGWFRGDLRAYASMFGSTTDHAEAMIKEILRYKVGSLGTVIGGEKDFVDWEEGDAFKDANGNITLVNRRKFKEWKEQEASRLRSAEYRRRRGKGDDTDASRVRHADVTEQSSSPDFIFGLHSSREDLKRLIERACVRYAGVDAGIVEFAVTETLLKWSGPPGGKGARPKPIRSMEYFADEVEHLNARKDGLGNGLPLDAMLRRRREQLEKALFGERTAGPS